MSAKRNTLPLIAAAAFTLLPLTGCSSMPWSKKAPPPAVSTVNHTFHGAIRSAVTSIKAGELEQADTALEQAVAVARTPQERTQVRSLRLLVDGSKAMYRGDALAASDKWNQIPDRDLRQQVLASAQKVGFDMPKAQTTDPLDSRLTQR